jgi:hypothetical protein
MFRTHRALFNKLALQSVALSTAPSSLYDVSGGSGFPNPSIGLNTASSPSSLSPLPSATGKEGRAEVANGILFRELDQNELDALRKEIFDKEDGRDRASPDTPGPSYGDTHMPL